MGWVAWAEPAGPGLWKFAGNIEVSGYANRAMLRDSLKSLGALAVIAPTGDAAIALLDDEQGLCRVCQAGRGRHACKSCESAVLTASLAASVEMNHRRRRVA